MKVFKYTYTIPVNQHVVSAWHWVFSHLPHSLSSPGHLWHALLQNTCHYLLPLHQSAYRLLSTALFCATDNGLVSVLVLLVFHVWSSWPWKSGQSTLFHFSGIQYIFSGFWATSVTDLTLSLLLPVFPTLFSSPPCVFQDYVLYNLYKGVHRWSSNAMTSANETQAYANYPVKKIDSSPPSDYYSDIQNRKTKFKLNPDKTEAPLY